MARSLGSLKAGPRNDRVTGNPSPVNPAGTTRSGKPVKLAKFTGFPATPPGGSVALPDQPTVYELARTRTRDSWSMSSHELHKFMRKASESIAADYARIAA